MTTTATIRSHGYLDSTSAARIADHWNTAYPTMRVLATDRINAYRLQVRDEAWKVDPAHPHAEAIQAFTPSEATIRRRLANLEALRRTLGQLDRGTHRACTRSPGGFSVLAAYSAVRSLLGATTVNDEGLAAVYQLAAVLSEAAEERHRELAATTSAAEPAASTSVRVFHRTAGWTMTDPGPEPCTSNFHREQDGRPACTGTSVWKVVEERESANGFPMLSIGFYCDADLPDEHKPRAAA